MAIVRKLGYPIFFITVTANLNWLEIQRELLTGQTAVDRPDIVRRVFELKCQAILQELKGGLLGTFTGTVWTIEYQKRGLPYWHILLFLSLEDSRCYLDPAIIDRSIRAEIPTEAEDLDRRLRAIITSNMIYGLYGLDSPDSPCMVRDP